MATAPVKSRHLHNFSLPQWGHKDQMNATNQFGKPSEAAVLDSPPPLAEAEHCRSSPSVPCSDGSGGSKNESDLENRKLVIVSRSAQRNRFSIAACSSQKQQSAVLKQDSNEADGEREKEKVVDEVVEAEESVAKLWNLRPRKANSKVGGSLKNGELRETDSAVPAENLPKSTRLRGVADGQCSEKKEKRKLWIALSRVEIEEDLFAMTGLKPARRPKKRPKAVQNQIDNILPGLNLAGITAKAYRVE